MLLDLDLDLVPVVLIFVLLPWYRRSRLMRVRLRSSLDLLGSIINYSLFYRD